jgi:uncharacterized protein (TIGR03790 family)
MHRASGHSGRSRRPIPIDAYTIRSALNFQIAAIVLALFVRSGAAGAEAVPDHVLVVVNDASEISRSIGEYYRSRRRIPMSHVVHVSVPLIDPTLSTYAHELISRADFEQRIRGPIASFLDTHDLRDRIEILVTTKGLPLRIREAAGSESRPFYLRDRASVDAELAVLYSDLVSNRGLANSVNPYFRSDEPFRAWRARHPDSPLRYLVARLTGYQLNPDSESGVPEDIKALIDAASASGPSGRYLIDEDPAQPASRLPANVIMLGAAAAALEALNLPLVHDRTERFRGGVQGIAGYASWGSNSSARPEKPYYGQIGNVIFPGTFGTRAVTVDLVSYNARSFTYPTRYGQSLLADLIRLGAAGCAGHVDEPTLSAVARPHILFGAYAQGVPAAEAYFRSLPFLGWTNVYIGDPLLTVAHPPAATPLDRDGDGVRDKYDNCLVLPNADQRDSDEDGFGNLCDADFDGDGRVGTSNGKTPFGDIERLRRSVAHGFYIPDHDLNGDGKVDLSDLSIAELNLHLPPGPSGRRLQNR